MPARRLPQSDEARYSALRNGKFKVDNTPGQTVVQAATVIRLNTKEPELKGFINTRNAALQDQLLATNGVNADFKKSKMVFSHCIQSINHAIERGEPGFTVDIHAHYGIDENDDTVPVISSDDDMLTWGQRLLDGEAARILDGGTAIAFPSTANFNTLYFAPYKTKLAAQSLKKEAYDAALESIEDNRDEYDDLILRIWEEVELAFYNETPPSKRRKAREYGVVYTLDQGEVVTVQVPHSSTVTADDVSVDEDSVFTIHNLSTIPLKVCRSTTANAACTGGVIIPAGATMQLTGIQLGTEGSLLNFTNEDATVDGSAEVSE